jgi:ABC-2 type transport system permease protein
MARGRLAAVLRAYPTLLRVGFAEAVAYRAESLVWMLTNTMPLVNLALWSAVARSGPIGAFGAATGRTPGGGVVAGGAFGSGRGFDQAELTAYFLGALIVRQLTSCWVLWEMEREIRLGMLSMRLLRPIHPLVAYSAENLSALPLRAAFVVPIGLIGLAVAGRDRLTHDPLAWAVLPLCLVGAWLINFLANTLMGTLNFFFDKALAAFNLWLGAYFVLSGYMFPIDFLQGPAPRAVRTIRALPFYAMAGFPVEVLLGLRSRAQILESLTVQWAYVAALAAGTFVLWRAGVRRFNAYGA